MKIAKYLFPALMLVLMAFAPGKEKKKKGKSFEGKITYSMTYEDLPAELENYASMLPKEMITYVKGDKSRIEQNSGMGTTVTLVDKAKKEMYILMDMMGSKTAYKGGPEDMTDTAKSGAPVVKLLEETKEIAGKTCNKAEVSSPGEDPSIVWYTKDLPAGLSRGMSYIDGFPMEYYVKRNGMTILMTVTAISEEKVSPNYFKIPDGYTIKPMSEMKAMMGGK